MLTDKLVELIAEAGVEPGETEEAIKAHGIENPFEFLQTLMEVALEDDDDEDDTIDDLLDCGVISDLDYDIDADGSWTLSFKKEHLK